MHRIDDGGESSELNQSGFLAKRVTTQARQEITIAGVAQLGEQQTEVLEVPCSIHGPGIHFAIFHVELYQTQCMHLHRLLWHSSLDRRYEHHEERGWLLPI